MVDIIPTPDPHVLLPPLLASLPTSFASARPPPEFLTLLSPILRQRLQIHTTTPSSNHDNWLRLLCWDSAKAEELKDQVENANFEPHPSSGEIEVGDIEALKYKRFDLETLKAQIALSDWNLTAIYLWCAADEGGAGWKLAELLPLDTDLTKDSTWSSSIEAANKMLNQSLGRVTNPLERRVSVQGNEDDYWAMYDATPGRTPQRQGSVNPPTTNATEDDYYAQYGDVQPAMDNYDPDEAHEDSAPAGTDRDPQQHPLSQSRLQEQDSRTLQVENGVPVSHPVPSSPSSRAGSDTVARLESSAERHAASEIGIRQHISTTVKSMYRLAKSAGMTKDEFDEMVQRELDTLSILDQGE
jgi:hypothetical protein